MFGVYLCKETIAHTNTLHKHIADILVAHMKIHDAMNNIVMVE
jgi:hypothetical protein